MDVLVQTLYVTTTYLLVPVVLALLGLLAWSLLELGGFFREGRERRRTGRSFAEFEAGLRQGNRKAEEFFDLPGPPGFLGRFQGFGLDLATRSPHAEKIADDLEIAAEGLLARMKLGVRLGPMLGLMGTLIPMGPALLGLSKGDLDVLARNLVVAFATTVLGLLAGGICYGIALSRRRWYASDLAAVEYLRRCLELEKEEA